MSADIRNMPENFGGAIYQDITNIHPLAVGSIVIFSIALLSVPRRLSLVPMLIIACFISSVQKVSIFGLDFNLLRIMVIFGFVRLILKKEYINYVWKPIDTAVILWTISSMLVYSMQQGSSSAIINRLGLGLDAFGMYFMFRCLIQKWSDVDCIVSGLVFISLPVTLFFLIEKATGQNLFSIFGGVPAVTMIREDRLRCQGAFPHPIIAGCFWAALMPLFAACWWKSMRGRILALTGLATSSIIVFCCSSSTPIMGVLSAMIGGVFFFFRRHMRVVRWCILLTLISLHMVMKAPVWHLISRVSAVGGSTSYFRYALINGAITHFNEWALIGTKSTAHWFWGAQDVCNQYILVGVEGGILTLCLFMTIIIIAFREVGVLWRLQTHKPYHLALSWALGVSLFVQCMNFIGVSYFGQIWIVWYLLLAIIGSLCEKNGSLILQNISSSSISASIHSRKNRFVRSQDHAI